MIMGNLAIADSCSLAWQEPPDGWLDNFATVRPVLETGWESVPIAHLLVTGVPPAEVLRDLHTTLKTRALAEIGHDEAAVKAAFRSARDGMIQADCELWLGLHGFYKAAVEAVQHLVREDVPVFIITTKAKDFAERLLHTCGLDIPPERVFGLSSGPKPQVLARLLTERGGRCLFVEDRVQTLITVQKDKAVSSRVDLVLADWGYNTHEDRQLAQDHGVCVCSQSSLEGVLRNHPT